MRIQPSNFYTRHRNLRLLYFVFLVEVGSEVKTLVKHGTVVNPVIFFLLFHYIYFLTPKPPAVKFSICLIFWSFSSVKCIIVKGLGYHIYSCLIECAFFLVLYCSIGAKRGGNFYS